MKRINLTKKEIINSIYMQIGFSKVISETLLEDIFDILLQNIIKNKKVKIAKFGTFELRYKKQRVGRNPKTKQEKTIKTNTTKSILCLSSSDFVKPLRPPVILFADLDILNYFLMNSITDLVQSIPLSTFFSLIVHGPIIFTF